MCECKESMSIIVGSDEQKSHLFTALKQFQESCPPIPLDKEVKVQPNRNSGVYTFRYASLTKIVEKVKPIMAQNNLSITQIFGNNTLITILMHEKGGYIKSEINLDFPAGITMQEKGSMISYLKRYSYSAILGIVTDEDDDANLGDNNTYQYVGEETVNGNKEEKQQKIKNTKKKQIQEEADQPEPSETVFDILDSNNIQYEQSEGMILVTEKDSIKKIQTDEPMRTKLKDQHGFKWDSYQGIWKLKLEDSTVATKE